MGPFEARFKMRDFVKDQLGTWRHNVPESGMDPRRVLRRCGAWVRVVRVVRVVRA